MMAIDLARAIKELGHGDPRCGFVGPRTIRVFCPVCQCNGPRHDGDQPHLLLAVTPEGLDARHGS